MSEATSPPPSGRRRLRSTGEDAAEAASGSLSRDAATPDLASARGGAEAPASPLTRRAAAPRTGDAGSGAGPATVVEPPSPDVEAAPATLRVPGAPREGYHQLPTAPVITREDGPSESPPDDAPLLWAPPVPPVRRSGVGAWALGLAIVALAASLLVGWMLPLALVAIVLGVVALRRRGQPRRAAVWGIALGTVASVYSAGWLIFAAKSLGLL